MPKYLPTVQSGPTWVLRFRYTGPSSFDLMMRAPGLSLTSPPHRKAASVPVFSNRSMKVASNFNSDDRDPQQQAGTGADEAAGLLPGRKPVRDHCERAKRERHRREAQQAAD